MFKYSDHAFTREHCLSKIFVFYKTKKNWMRKDLGLKIF